MLKGLPIKERTKNWHLKLERKKKKRFYHNLALSRRAAFYKAYDERMKTLEEADRLYKKSINRERQITVGLWGRIKLFFSRLFRKKSHA